MLSLPLCASLLPTYWACATPASRTLLGARYPTLTRRTSRKRSVLHARNTSPRCILFGTLGEHRGSEALCTRAGLHIASCLTHLENSEEAKRITQAAPLRIELHSTHSETRGSGAFYTRAAPRHTALHSNHQANIKEAKRIARKLHRSTL